MSLTYDQRIQIAQIAKEITLNFAGKLNYTDKSNTEAMNRNLSEIVNNFYSETFNSIVNLVDQE